MRFFLQKRRRDEQVLIPHIFCVSIYTLDRVFGVNRYLPFPTRFG